MSSYVPDDYMPPTPDDFAAWKHYLPDGYPITDEHHNPWLPIDPISGRSAFNIWDEDRNVSEEDFRQKLDAIKEGDKWHQRQRTASFETGGGYGAASADGSSIARYIQRARAGGAEESSSLPVVPRTRNGRNHPGRSSDIRPTQREDCGVSARGRFPGMSRAHLRAREDDLAMNWSKLETAIGAKCKECGKIIAEGDATTSNKVFETARIHAETEGHSVVIRQVERIEVSP